jgi:hypothetical protein
VSEASEDKLILCRFLTRLNPLIAILDTFCESSTSSTLTCVQYTTSLIFGLPTLSPYSPPYSPSLPSFTEWSFIIDYWITPKRCLIGQSLEATRAATSFKHYSCSSTLNLLRIDQRG